MPCRKKIRSKQLSTTKMSGPGADTLSVASGERWTVAYTAKDSGVWAWRCHILTHTETPTGMRYMVNALIVADK